MSEPVPTFDTMPGMIFGLKQQVSDLTAKVETLISISKPHAIPDEIRFYGDRELARYLNCTIQTVSCQKSAGRIPFHRYGRKYYYLRSEIDLAFKGRV